LTEIRGEKARKQAALSAQPLEKSSDQKTGFSIKLQIADTVDPTPGEKVVNPMQPRRSADHAMMIKVKQVLGRGGSFHIPIQACEKIESSESD